mmetsp:Transcript_40584/g.81835  ORF Transcript_40584/g.81835 Transcript_40584/m.81835 type:complete len:221 (+) Transcript_40584:521-1183(+)
MLTVVECHGRLWCTVTRPKSVITGNMVRQLMFCRRRRPWHRLALRKRLSLSSCWSLPRCLCAGSSGTSSAKTGLGTTMNSSCGLSIQSSRTRGPSCLDAAYTTANSPFRPCTMWWSCVRQSVTAGAALSPCSSTRSWFPLTLSAPSSSRFGHCTRPERGAASRGRRCLWRLARFSCVIRSSGCCTSSATSTRCYCWRRPRARRTTQLRTSYSQTWEARCR